MSNVHMETEMEEVHDEQPASSDGQNNGLVCDGAEHNTSDSNAPDEFDKNDSELNESTTNENYDAEIVQAVLKAFEIAEEMSASQKNLMEIIEYGRDLHCQGNTEKLNRWPKNYAACLQVLRNAGYKDPTIYRVCLNEAHPNLWSIKDQTENCQYCGQQGPIMYYYLSLADKVKRWCSDKEFCYKMTAHWRERVTWMNSGYSDSQLMNETWHGKR